MDMHKLLKYILLVVSLIYNIDLARAKGEDPVNKFII